MSDTKETQDKLPEDAEALARALLDQTPRLQLWRRSPEGKYVYGIMLATADFSLDFVAQKWGGGDYQARFVGDKGRVMQQVTFEIDGPSIPFRTKPPEEDAADPLQRVMDRLDQLEGGKGKGEDTMGLVVQLAGMMANQQTSLLTTLLPLIVQDRGAGAMTPADMMQLIKDARELAAPEDDSLLRTLGVPVVQTLQQLAGTDRGAQAPHQLHPGPTAPPPRPPDTPMILQNTPGAQMPPYWATMLSDFFPQLLQLARARGDVGWWAEQILDRATEAQLVTIRDALEAPTFFSEFLTWFPQAVPERVWFERFWEAISEHFPEEGDDDPTTTEEE